MVDEGDPRDRPSGRKGSRPRSGPFVKGHKIVEVVRIVVVAYIEAKHEGG